MRAPVTGGLSSTAGRSRNSCPHPALCGDPPEFGGGYPRSPRGPPVPGPATAGGNSLARVRGRGLPDSGASKGALAGFVGAWQQVPLPRRFPAGEDRTVGGDKRLSSQKNGRRQPQMPCLRAPPRQRRTTAPARRPASKKSGPLGRTSVAPPHRPSGQSSQ